MPPEMTLGPMQVNGTMEGSHLAPRVSLSFQAAESRVSGSATFSQTAVGLSAKGPQFR